MADSAPTERRDLQSLIADMRVDVAAIKTRSELQTGALARLENKLDLGVFREEYERRHADLIALCNRALALAELVRDENLTRAGSERTWRLVFTGAIAILGVVAALRP